MAHTIIEEIKLVSPTQIMPTEKEFELTKEQWARLSPAVKEMIRKDQVHLIKLPKYNPAYK